MYQLHYCGAWRGGTAECGPAVVRCWECQTLCTTPSGMQKENKSLSLDQVAHLCNQRFRQAGLVRDETLHNSVISTNISQSHPQPLTKH